MPPSLARSHLLIKTKLAAPQRRAGLVARPRLTQRLAEGSQRALTLVCAPPGYGKTTLLVEWLSGLPKSAVGAGPKVCWLSLDEGDNDPALFLSYLTAALETGTAQVCREARAALETFPPPPFQTVLSVLINCLDELPGPIYLALDDYQFISNRAIHDGLAYFLDHLPGSVHVIIAARSDPPLPLARLRVRNQLSEVRASDLRFSAEEAADFLTQAMRLPVSAEDIAALETRTEGWIAGLQMAALALQSLPAQDRAGIAHFIQVFSGSHRYVLDYLAEEVLNRQPDELRRFLFTTSILDRLCAPLCDALIADPAANSQAALEQLERSNLFLISLDDVSALAETDEQPWFRYHHLFADLLRARLRQSEPALVPVLHLRAAEWYDRHGFAAEAVQHSLAAGDPDRAADLIERHGSARWSSGDPSILNLTHRLPPELLHRKPRLGIYQAWMLIAQGQSQAALPLLERLKAHLRTQATAPSDRWMPALIELLSAYAADSAAGPVLAELPDYALLDGIPEQDLGLRSTADFLYAILLNRRGGIARSAEILRQSIGRTQAGGGGSPNALIVTVLARNLMMLGKLSEAAELCQKYLESGAEAGKGNFYAAGSLNIVLGEILYEWNDLERAEQQIRAGLQTNAPWQNLLMDAIGCADLAGVQSARGDLSVAAETMDRLERLLAGRTETLDLEEELEAIQVRLWLARGETARVETWANQVAASEPVNYLQGWRHLTLARVRLTQGRYSEAQQILEALAQQPGADQRVHRQVRVDLLLAILQHQQNQNARAFRALEACFRSTQPGGYCRVFLDSGAPVRDLLQAYLRSPDPACAAYARRLLDLFPQPTAQPAPANLQSALAEPLTPRELEVLGLMAAGLSNRQIAEKLVLSEGTVKYHVHNILEKLGLHSRTQAIIKARELNLV